MAETKITGGNIANVERIKIVTIETTPKTYVIEVATNLTFTGVVSAGAEQELRVKNTVHGVLRTEDIVKGYDLQLDDPKYHPQIFALVDGGAVTGTPGQAGEKYTAPVAGSPVSRTPFDLYAYSSDRDNDGDADAYHEWKFPNCKGKPVDGSLKDGEFSTQQYKLASRPAAGVSPMTVERIAALPSTTTT
jgi:hypothetical protein